MEMDYDDLKSYMFQYVRQFLPYKDDELYQVLIKFLEDELLYDSYVNIPEKFKVLFEDHTLNTYLYDVVLRSLGFPRDMVESLPTTHKQIVLSTFNDYHNRKGSFKIIKEVGAAFSEPINLYELYADFRCVSGEWNWWFTPKEIYCAIDGEPDYEDYDEIYNDTPTYFVSKQQLHNLMLEEQISLPIKTNLIKLSMEDQTDSDEMNILVMMTTLHYFKDEIIDIQLQEGAYDVSLHGVYQLWNYLLSRYRGEVSSVAVDGEIVYYDISSTIFPYTLETGLDNSIATIVEEYDALMYADEITAFYQKYIEGVFQASVPSTIQTIATLRKSVLYSVDIDLMDEIDEMLDSATSETTEILLILQELRDSIIMYIASSGDSLLVEYQDYILTAFEISILSPSDTTTYKLIDFFKPFHTQVIAKKQQVVTNKSKFNNTGIVDDDSMIILRDYPGTVYQISDDVYFMDRFETTFELTEFTITFTDETVFNKFNIGDQILVNDEDCIDNTGTTIDGSWSVTDLVKYNPERIVTIKEMDNLTLTFESGFYGLLGTYNAIYHRYHITELEGELNHVD